MITVPEAIEELIKQHPFLEEGLSQGIINLSSLARQLQPRIQKKLFKDVQIGAIIMGLNRLEEKLKSAKTIKSSPIPLADLTVRSNLVEFTFQNSPTLLEKQEQLLQFVGKGKNNFLTFTYGVFETTLIISKTLEKTVEILFKNEALKSNFTNLSSITLFLPEETINQPGIYYQILKKLAWEGINLIEIISSFTELTIIMEDSQVDKAFSVLKS